MEGNTTTTTDSKHDIYYQELHEKSYRHLIEFSELEEEELTDDTCENAVNALANILKYGSCHDVATGIKCLVNFVQSKNELAERS